MESKLSSPLRSAYRRREYRRHNVYAWVFILAQGLLAAAFIFVFFLSPAIVSGESMSPTLIEQDILLIDKLSLFLRSPKRGDIVIFKNDGAELIKRVIALPGETIGIYDNKIYINGYLLDESIYSPSSAGEDFEEILVEPNTVFVMGDDRQKSLDSRFIGPIPLSSLDGLVRFRISPLNRAAIFS